MEPVIKRLHVSGLTPAISPDDLSRRLSGFGTVKVLDGFGKLDGLGQPRKYGYVTLETTKGQLAKCLNVLSGSTWKGTKLRIGEAKPDFRERLDLERAKAEAEPPKKKRRREQGVHAADMSPVTPEDVNGRGGWRVTPMGRMVRPLRMRPERPLEPQIAVARGAKKAGPNGKEKKKRVKAPAVRARRRTIDPTKWDSVHLKGMFLDAEGVVIAREEPKEEAQVDGVSSEDENSSSGESDAPMTAMDHVPEDAFDKPHQLANEPVTQPQPAILTTGAMSKPLPQLQSMLTPAPVDIARENEEALGLLRSLFGSREDDWAGRESIGSDIDEEELLRQDYTKRPYADDEMQIEEVPLEVHRKQTSWPDVEDELPDAAQVPSPPPTIPTQMTKLKDLFAPREEEAGFSLLGHLDLDLELDDDIAIPISSRTQTVTTDELSAPPTLPEVLVPPSYADQFTFDSSLPFFFPFSTEFRDSLRPRDKGRIKDLFDVAKEKGWDWRDAGFYRTETEDEIRQRWEGSKLELTREWKRRHREAGKSRRRRGGVDD
ncbi:hypothetical protein BV22DRAFT_1196524 [Leucogyrophana mollusca]|uniref:Uncharacterized protein n=1 Tax=Leucogyrophana mollusca TaxID=85980 RepID=A0ACB8BFW7_9AGAM|nr:hypothetical protein BV22DRAFT_1196524 [Leucogyrophana mollusca]